MVHYPISTVIWLSILLGVTYGPIYLAGYCLDKYQKYKRKRDHGF